MPLTPDSEIDCRWRSRVVFIHSRGSGLFLGGKPESREREVTVEEVEALTSAGFEIVEINMREGTPLCAALARVPSEKSSSNPRSQSPEATLTAFEPRTASVV